MDGKKITFYGLLSAIIVFLGFSINKFLNDTNEIDQLERLLKPISFILEKNPPHVSLLADSTDLALFFKTQFILVPAIVEERNPKNDTVLIIQKIGIEEQSYPIENCNVLYSQFDEDFKVTLCVKRKSK